MLVTLSAQKERRCERGSGQSRDSAHEQPRCEATALLSQPSSADSAAAPAKKPIASLTRRAANSGTANNASPAVSIPAASRDESAGGGEAEEDELTSHLDRLALTAPSSRERPTPLQALAARPRGAPPTSSSRPATDTAAARRLVMGALGRRNERSEEEKEKERQSRREHQRMRREQLDAQKMQAAGRQQHARGAEEAQAS